MTRRHTNAARFPYTTLFRSINTRMFMFMRVNLSAFRSKYTCSCKFIRAQIEICALTHVYTRLYKYIRGELNLRSEEHTSELQSRGHLVCRLLLEKKNKKGKP